MKIVLTFDIEIWCNGWMNIDEKFPKAFERYFLGCSKAGCFALPKTIDILKKNNLHGVFFVEPLFAARFGLEYLKKIISYINNAGHEIQLHLHPEWTDEITPSPLPNITQKRQHLSHYSFREQVELIKLGVDLLQKGGALRPTAFRAGNFSANEDTYRALYTNKIYIDSSINATMENSVPDLREKLNLFSAQPLHGVKTFPMSVFRDGIGRLRHAQLGACSSSELIQAMQCAEKFGWEQFVVLSHNVEMLKIGTSHPDWIVVKRFENLCKFLRLNVENFPTVGINEVSVENPIFSLEIPKVNKIPTYLRLSEQAFRKLI